MTMMIFWGVVFVLMVIAECASMQLVSIWFAVGSLGAFFAAMLNLGFTGQLAIFVLVSFILLLVTRPLLKKLRVQNVVPMNADKEIGATAVIIEEVNAATGTGRVRLNGVDWIAVSENGTIIPVNTVVTVQQVQGAKLIVAEATIAQTVA
ncbi:MAG: NfeD family protein [Oscillospiraceae bacterium]